MAGQRASVEPETTVLLPARIVTGNDGTIGLTQAGTNINVSNDTDVEIPAEAVDGNLIARLVQHSGNVFYDVAPRDVGKLRVETPLLVAVIKGTQFNVAVEDGRTTISLFEGRLELRTPDGSDVVQLNAGEIAIRSLTDTEIRVVGMNDESVAAPRSAQPAVAAAVDGRFEAGQPLTEGGTVDVRLEGVVHAGSDVGDASAKVELDTGLDLGGGTVDLGLSPGVDLAGATVDLGLDTGVDLGGGTVDVGVDAGVDLGAAVVDLGLDSGIDLGAGSVDLGLDAEVDLGAPVVDLGLDAGLDLGALDADLDAGLDVGGVDTSLDAGVDLGAGTVDLGLDLGGVLDVDLGVDLGAGSIDLGLTGGAAAPSPAPPPPPRGGLGGLLGGLL